MHNNSKVPLDYQQQTLFSRGLIILLAFATGSTVANLYYLQPILHEVSQAFDVGSATASSLVTLTQFGYAIGLAFLVPLGDILSRRRFIAAIFGFSAVLMIIGAVVPSFLGFAIITFLLGLSSIGGQVIIPLSADFADPDKRGRVIGHLMTGALCGIIFSRAFSGVIAQRFGWRGVYWMAAGLMGTLAVVLYLVLPNERKRTKVTYGRLLKDALHLMKTLPDLRRRSWLGVTTFGAFTMLWTALAFELSQSPYHYSTGKIGAFGLVGIAGILAANVAGSLSDADKSKLMTFVMAIMMIASFGILALGGHSIFAIIVGIIVLDIATQGMQITNQSIIYTLAPNARSRINSAYMVCYFIGGSLGSLAGGLAYSAGGWGAVCTVGAILGLGALAPCLWWFRKAPALLGKSQPA